LNEIVDTMESVGNKTLAKGKPARVFPCKILLKQVLHRKPPAALILHITHPKNQKEKCFKGCIFH
jgi:hypothetical protein